MQPAEGQLWHGWCPPLLLQLPHKLFDTPFSAFGSMTVWTQDLRVSYSWKHVEPLLAFIWDEQHCSFQVMEELRLAGGSEHLRLLFQHYPDNTEAQVECKPPAQ